MEFVRRNQSLAVLPSFNFLTDYIFLKICRRICVLSTDFRVARWNVSYDEYSYAWRPCWYCNICEKLFV